MPYMTKNQEARQHALIGRGGNSYAKPKSDLSTRSDLMPSNMLVGENFVTVVRYMSVTMGNFLSCRDLSGDVTEKPLHNLYHCLHSPQLAPRAVPALRPGHTRKAHTGQRPEGQRMRPWDSLRGSRAIAGPGSSSTIAD